MDYDRSLTAMRRDLVLTLLGRDRPGIVEAVAARVAEHGGNWLESRMARMAGHFAGMLRVSVPADAADELRTALAELEREGLSVTVAAIEDEPGPAAAVSELATLHLVGPDRPGIIRETAQALAASAVNVEELHTGCESAPMSGEILFRARAVVRLPAGVDRRRLLEEIEAVAESLTLELDVGDGGSDRARS